MKSVFTIYKEQGENKRLSLYFIDEPRVHSYRKLLEAFKEDVETLEGLVEVGKREEVLNFVSEARKVSEQFTLEGIGNALFEKTIHSSSKLDIKEKNEHISELIEECVNSGLFRKIIN